MREVIEQIDALSSELLLSLRKGGRAKQLDKNLFARLTSAVDELGRLLNNETQVSKDLVGTLWFIFTSMLAEADHANDPEPILSAAWDIQERLTRIFGPHFPDPPANA
jgi:hypothetical protein